MLHSAAQRLGPASLVNQALDSNMREFLMLYGDTQFLLVALDRDVGDLKTGLLAMSAAAGTTLQPSINVMSYDTIIAQDEVLTSSSPSEPPADGFDAEDLLNLVIQRAHIAVALRKRVMGPEHSGRISIGRARDNDVVLRDASVSKFHAWFEMDEEGSFYLADAGSTNGTRVDDTRLTPNELVRAPPGANMKLGSVGATICSCETLWRALHDVY